MHKAMLFLFASHTLALSAMWCPVVKAQLNSQLKSHVKSLLLLEDVDPGEPTGHEIILQYGDRALPALREVLSAPRQNNLDDARHASALGVLARIGGNVSKLTPLVRKHLLSHSPDVRFRAVQTLAELGDSKDNPLFVAMLNDPDIDVRREAIQALGKHGGRNSLLALEIWRTREAEADETRPVPDKLLRSAIPKYVTEAQTSMRKRILKSQE